MFLARSLAFHLERNDQPFFSGIELCLLPCFDYACVVHTSVELKLLESCRKFEVVVSVECVSLKQVSPARGGENRVWNIFSKALIVCIYLFKKAFFRYIGTAVRR